MDNNSPLLGYELQATTGADLPATEDGWVIVDAHIDPEYSTPETPADPACRLYSGLVANEVYWFRVRAYNLSGHGHWSAPYCGFRSKPITESGASRSPIPIQADH